MQNKNRKDIWLFILLIPVFLWLSLNYADHRNDNGTSYSVLNRGSKGMSIIYETMKKLNYPVKLVLDNVEDKSHDKVQIIVSAKNNRKFNINNDEIKKWIKNGGKLVYLYEDLENRKLKYGKKINTYEKNDGSVYSYGKGKILTGNIKLIANKTLTINTDGAYWILSQIDKWNYNSLEFNEFYLYESSQKPSLWRDIPGGVKFILFQLAILIGAIIFYKGKRFGRPIPLYEEVERSENEYIYSVAALYHKAGCWEVVLKSYYDDFLLQVEGLFGKNEYIKEEWLKLWENKNLPKLNKAKKLYRMINSLVSIDKSEKKRRKKYLETISIIEELKKILIKRRESHWKRLKKDIQRI
ncbi:hypothetical protein [Maledivibacter halophilus]|uniref:hypothetical protein n=1 Tax=Maledivibacter halophilus TaxID=36842 RepID=UPI0009A69026|nr:hypothetical protein [Maledivibacter halophilus]